MAETSYCDWPRDCVSLPETTSGEGVSRSQKGIAGWFFAALEMEEIKQLPTLPGVSENPSLVGLLRIEEQLVFITTAVVHWQQYHIN